MQNNKISKSVKNEYVYRILLKYLYDLGLVNQCYKFNTKYVFTLETDMQRFNQTADALPRTVDSEIILTSAPYIMYEQFKLDKNFRTYLEGVLLSEHVLRTGIRATPYQRSLELVSGTVSPVVEFQGSNKQFSFLAISLVYDKSDQHRSIYASYNGKVASTMIKSIQLQNASSTYSSFNSVKFDRSNAHDKFLLYSQFVAQYCKISSIAPISDYAHNPTFQELPTISQYFTNTDEKIFIDVRRGKGYTNELEKINRGESDLSITITLKRATTTKMRLRVTGYYQGEYLYSVSHEGLIMSYKESKNVAA